MLNFIVSIIDNSPLCRRALTHYFSITVFVSKDAIKIFFTSKQANSITDCSYFLYERKNKRVQEQNVYLFCFNPNWPKCL